MDEQRPELLVALGDDGGLAALDWAVARALRSGLGLRLVHVVHPPRGLAGPENLLLDFDAVELVGRQIVRSGLERVADLSGGDLTVRTAVPAGHAVGVLSRLATGCTAVIAQHRPHGHDGHLFGGSVTAGVASRVKVPVVSVPDDWVPGPAEPTDALGVARRVTVGVASTEDADELIGHVIATAALGPGACLTLVHAWHVPAAYELGLMPPDFEVGWLERETRALDELAAPWQGRYPLVELETRVEHGRPVSVLVEASRNSAHLVLGRAHAHPLRHVGSVAAALLRHAACPVELVPLTRRDLSSRT